jgi:Cd2+/Zn2+-exporting ATPase
MAMSEQKNKIYNGKHSRDTELNSKKNLASPQANGDGHDQDEDHEHNQNRDADTPGWKKHWQLLLSLSILVIMLIMEFGFEYKPVFPIDLIIYLSAFLLGGYNVLFMAFTKAKHFDFFNEFFLMSVATIGAFAIGSYSEGVAVMIFYSIGEWFQDSAVNKAKRSIKALLDIRPDEVTVMRNGNAQVINPKEIIIDEIIQVKPGEKVALDGELISATASFNTAALTGESRPDTKSKGEKVFAGMINLNTVSEVQVKSLFKDSKLSKILEMVLLSAIPFCQFLCF